MTSILRVCVCALVGPRDPSNLLVRVVFFTIHQTVILFEQNAQRNTNLTLTRAIF